MDLLDVPLTDTHTPQRSLQTAATRVIDLDPADWFLATWRTLQPLRRPPAAPFDLADCLGRLEAITTSRRGQPWDWERLSLAEALTRPEAHFWLVAMTGGGPEIGPRKLPGYLARQTFDGNLTPEDVQSMLAPVGSLHGRVLTPLANLLTPEQVLELLLTVATALRLAEPTLPGKSARREAGLRQGFARSLLPYLSADERLRLRRRLAPEVHPSKWTNGWSTPPALAFRLAALLGLHDELLAVVLSWTNNTYDRFKVFSEVVFGLGDPGLVRDHLRRLRWRMNSPARLRDWLAHTDFTGLEEVRDALLSLKAGKADDLMRVFCLVRAPEAAPIMLELKLAGVAPRLAQRWLDEQVGNAVAGLLPVAAGRGRLAEAALDYLRAIKDKGLISLLDQQLQHTPPRLSGRVRRALLEQPEQLPPPLDEATTPDWLRSALEAAGAAPVRTLPGWLLPARLPPLPVGDRRLNDRQVRALLACLCAGPLGAHQPLLAALKEQVAPAALEAFAWRLFEVWLHQGGPDEGSWVQGALGLLGGDASALKLTAFIRDWPGQGRLARALSALEVLQAIGSDSALMQLQAIAAHFRCQKVKEKARALLSALAADRGLKPEQLEDRTVPTLGLDLQGRTFDYGARQFRASVGPDLRPRIQGAGRDHADLPRPGARDDAALAAQAVRDWRLFRRQLRETLRVQAARLERAMIDNRRWKTASFEEVLVHHPLMKHLARLLVWAEYRKGKLLNTFRVTEEGAYADVRDAGCFLHPFAEVGIVHPVHLTTEERSAWGEVLGDYEIIPPFVQLARRVHVLDPKEETSEELKRFNGVRLTEAAELSVLKFKGWSECWSGAAGRARHFPGAHVTALIKRNGWGQRIINGVIFVRGASPQHGRLDLKHKLRLGEVDPIVFSEVTETLALLAGHASRAQ
jgi:hypothetical protein